MLMKTGTLYTAALIAGSCALATSAFAAAGALDPSAGAAVTVISLGDPYKLDTEMTVKNWVLCVSEGSAESLVKAHQESRQKADEVYAALQAGKTCGRFAEMRVILQQALYEPQAAAPYQARVFNALVELSGQWAKGFVVSTAE